MLYFTACSEYTFTGHDFFFLHRKFESNLIFHQILILHKDNSVSDLDDEINLMMTIGGNNLSTSNISSQLCRLINGIFMDANILAIFSMYTLKWSPHYLQSIHILPSQFYCT